MSSPPFLSRRPLVTNPSALTYHVPPQPDNTARIAAFYASLPSFAPTSLIPLPSLAAELGLKAVYVKAETSRLGLPSFKLLGASWAIRQAIIQRASLPSIASIQDLEVAVIEHGLKICAATDGNHGRAVARMGKLLGVNDVKIFVPKGLDVKTIEGIMSEGAEVIVVEGDYDESVRQAHRWGEETKDRMLIEGTAFEGYEDVPKWTVEGYSTMLHEIDTQLGKQKPTVIITPVGVGSLAQATVMHYKDGSGVTSVVAIEPDTAGSLYKSLRVGRSLSIKTSSSIMTGLECGTISTAAWPLLKAGVDVSATVSDFEVHEAIEYLELNGVKAGPCGAAALAGLRRFASECSASELNESSIVVLLCTEGSRGYKIPKSVAVDDLLSLMQTMTDNNPSNSELNVSSRRALASYVIQWLEHRDIDVRWSMDSSNHPVITVLLRTTNAGRQLILQTGVGTVKAFESGDVTETSIELGQASMDVKSRLAACLIAISRARVS